jgi:PTH1 family peptidyl-tRNA hydrolase
MSEKYLIVGLGNPGREYKHHRHNVGFQIVDHLARWHGLAFSRRQARSLIASGGIAGRPVILAKPQTYMNRSGEAVNSLRKFYQIEWERIMIVFDDLDLPVGTLRLRPDGGSSGQNGMKSIIQHLGGEDFSRLRVGIGRPPGRMEPAAYVLQNFNREQLETMALTYERAADALELWLREGIELAMSRFNGPAPE